MSARDLIFASIRRSLGVSGNEAPRRKTVDDRLAQHPAGIVPARGQLAPRERLALFRAMVEAKDIAGDYETLWRRLREKFGDGLMPRAVNLITGPSRSADIKQTLILGAHGPRRLHVMVVGEAEQGVSS